MKIENIHWHDSTVKDLWFDFSNNKISLAFQEFGTGISYILDISGASIKSISLEDVLSLGDCEVSSLKTIDSTHVSLGLYSPMNGYMELLISYSKINILLPATSR